MAVVMGIFGRAGVGEYVRQRFIESPVLAGGMNQLLIIILSRPALASEAAPRIRGQWHGHLFALFTMYIYASNPSHSSHVPHITIHW